MFSLKKFYSDIETYNEFISNLLIIRSQLNKESNLIAIETINKQVNEYKEYITSMYKHRDKFNCLYK